MGETAGWPTLERGLGPLCAGCMGLSMQLAGGEKGRCGVRAIWEGRHLGLAGIALLVGRAAQLGPAEVASIWLLGSFSWVCILDCIGPGFGPTIGSILGYKMGLKHRNKSTIK